MVPEAAYLLDRATKVQDTVAGFLGFISRARRFSGCSGVQELTILPVPAARFMFRPGIKGTSISRSGGSTG